MKADSAAHGNRCVLFSTARIFLSAALLAVAAVTAATARDAFAAGGPGPRGLVPLGAAVALGALLLISSGARAAVYAVFVLATSPSWYLAARAAPVPTGLVGLVLAGLAFAALARPAGRRVRLLALLASAAATAAAARSVGLVVVAGIPCLGVGLAALLAERPAARQPDPMSRVLSRALISVGAALVLGAIITGGSQSPAALAASRLFWGEPARASPVDFAGLVGHLAYGLAPWSPLLPFAFILRRQGRTVAAAVRSAFLLVTVLSLGVAGLVPSAQAHAGIAWAGSLAVGIGLLLERLDHEGRPFPLAAAGIVAFAALVAHDLALARAARGAVIALGAASAGGALVRPSALRYLRGSVLVAVGTIGGLYVRWSDVGALDSGRSAPVSTPAGTNARAPEAR
jgi:hypothetical protein